MYAWVDVLDRVFMFQGVSALFRGIRRFSPQLLENSPVTSKLHSHWRLCSMMSGSLSGKLQIQTDIKLTEVENKVCDLLKDFTNQYNESIESSGDEKLELRITGGWVRDKLLGSASHDLDIAINVMSGESFAIKLNDYLVENYLQYGLKPHSIHKIDKNPEKSKHLETATTKLFDIEVDFVNLRSEEYTSNSRIPTVEFGTPKQDALRRDATLNALFYNISQNKIEDFTGRGLEDLQNGILRTPLPPRQTFLDDPLRILRLIRFASRFNFSIDKEVEIAMGDADINRAFYTKISRERVGVEMEKIIDGETPYIGLSFIQKTNVDDVIFHWHNDQTIIGFNEKNNANNFNIINEIYDKKILNNHLSKVLEILQDKLLLRNELPILNNSLNNDPVFKRVFILSIILLPFQNLKIIWSVKKKVNNTIPVTESIVKDGLKFGKNEATIIAQIVDSIENYNKLVQFFKDDRLTLKRSDIGLFLRSFKGHWVIAHFVSLLNQMLPGNKTALNDYSIFYNYILDQKLEDCFNMKPLIDGKNLLALLDMKAGPWLGKINDAAIVWQLENPEGNKGQLLTHLKEILPTVL